MIPAKRDPNAKVEKTVEHVPVEKIVEDLQTIDRQKTPAAPPETYPLKKMLPYAEVLLVSYSDLKPCVQEKLGYKVDDVKMEEMAVAAIKKVLHKGDNKKFYKFIIVDLDEVSIIIERFGRSIKALLSDAGIPPTDVKLLAVSSNPSEKQMQHCIRANFEFITKPNKSMQLETFRSYMAPESKSSLSNITNKRDEMAEKMKNKQLEDEKKIEEKVKA